MSKPIVLSLLAALALTSSIGCKQSAASDTVKAEPSQQARAATTAVAEAVSVPEVLQLEGTLEANRFARLSPLVSGHVVEIKVERGDLVKKGDPLVILRSRGLRLAASSARARAKAQHEQLSLDEKGHFDVELAPDVTAARTDRDLAADNLRRLTPLSESGAIDARSFEQAKAAADAAESRLRSARQRALASYATYRSLSADAALRQDDANNTTLIAPFDGAIMARRAEVGEFVGPQQPIIELVDASRLRLQLDVPERAAAKVREGQVVRIEVDGSSAQLVGKVAFVSAALDPARRTLAIEAIVDNPEGKIRAGHFGRARLELDEVRKLVRVPTVAVAERAGVYRVYVVQDGRASARLVELVERDGDSSLVRGSIVGGETIVSPLVSDIADGVLLSL